MQNPKPKIPVLLIVVYVLALATILLWPIVAFSSVFAFDAPGSADDPKVWTIVITVLSYPLLPLVGVTGSFFAYRKGLSKLSYVLAGIGSVPLVVAVLIIVATTVMSAAAMFGRNF